MKKASKPVLKAPDKKAPAPKPAAVRAKPKTPATPKAKSAAKPKPRPAPVQLELYPLVERLTQAAERLAAAAEQLAETTAPKPPAPLSEPVREEDFKTVAEVAKAAKNENE